MTSETVKGCDPRYQMLRSTTVVVSYQYINMLLREMMMCVCVCVCIKFKYFVAYENNSDKLDIMHCRIKVKVIAGVQRYPHLPQYKLQLNFDKS